MIKILSRKKRSGASISKSLTQRIDLLRELVKRDIKLLYKRSFLGIAWTLINPMLQLLVFTFVFQLVLAINIPKYSSFVFTGLLVWTWFQNSLFQATGVIIASRSLIRQPGFPIAILPVVITTTGLIHFLLALPVLIIFLIIDNVALNTNLFVLPVLMAIQFLLTLSLIYPLAALNVPFRDTQHTLGVVLQLLFYMSGIFFQITEVPYHYKFWLDLNPVLSLVTAYRHVLIEGTQPDWFSLLLITAIAIGLLPVGLWYFKQQSDRFVEEI